MTKKYKHKYLYSVALSKPSDINKPIITRRYLTNGDVLEIIELMESYMKDGLRLDKIFRLDFKYKDMEEITVHELYMDQWFVNNREWAKKNT